MKDEIIFQRKRIKLLNKKRSNYKKNRMKNNELFITHWECLGPSENYLSETGKELNFTKGL